MKPSKLLATAKADYKDDQDPAEALRAAAVSFGLEPSEAKAAWRYLMLASTKSPEVPAFEEAIRMAKEAGA